MYCLFSYKVLYYSKPYQEGDMELSDVKIRLVNQDGKLKGVASLVIDGCFAVHDIKIVEGEGGVFVAMPSRKTPDGEYKDIVHPINSQTRELFKNKVLEAYRLALEEEQ